MDLTRPAPDRAPGRRPGRFSGWAVLGVLVAAGVAGPLLALPASFLDAVDPVTLTLLGPALGRSVLLGVGVAAGALPVGGALAVLVSFYDFPGRRMLEWALVLPLAMPGYVLVFVLVGQFGYTDPLQSSLVPGGLRLPGLYGPAGAIGVLTAVLYPYVYVLGRSAFLGQSRQALEAARGLGRSHTRAVWSVALPLARPALAGGVALAVMEALADFGVVNLLGYQALTDAIYRVWYGALDASAALQLATVLVGLALLMVLLERSLRGRARYQQSLARGDAVVPRRLRGVRAALACGLPSALLLVVFGFPVAQLVAWSVETVLTGRVASSLGAAVLSTVLLAAAAAAVAVLTSGVVAYGQRVRPTRVGAAAARLATVGYAVPGAVIAVAIYVPLVWLDRRLIDVAGALGADVGLLFTGTVLGLVGAYVVRFHAQAYAALESRMGRIAPNLDDAARALGADRARVLTDVHLPLLWPGILTAALLVVVEVVKELPATALLRPLGRDTLAILTWEATKDSRFDTAALPALLIVLVGLVPVVVLVRLWGVGRPPAR
ncbi:MAG: iron ABC transporter permease [Actinomycetota bacterium]|nr:iron ABC transporter permease [Actinomycetota bacterium]